MQTTLFPSNILLQIRLESDLETAIEALSIHLEEAGLTHDRASILRDYGSLLGSLVQAAAATRAALVGPGPGAGPLPAEIASQDQNPSL